LIGIILAGGRGERLAPITRAVNKHLLPVYDQPLIYAPLRLLRSLEIREIVIVTNADDTGDFHRLLGDGQEFGARIQYVIQDSPTGLAHAVNAAREAAEHKKVCVALGDNLFFGNDLIDQIKPATKLTNGAAILALKHPEPSQSAVLRYQADPRTGQQQVTEIIEKPNDIDLKSPDSNWIVPGLYFYDETLFRRIEKLKPSRRGEIEITDLNQDYLRDGQLTVHRLSTEINWFDAGTAEGLFQASAFARQEKNRLA
jgi:glucose-1-phosphate thymidylyltransferase